MRRRAFAAVALCCLLLGGCGVIRGERVVSGTATSGGAVATAGEDYARRAIGEVVVTNAHERGAFFFTATELDGQTTVSGVDLAEGPVVMTFVVPTCPICISKAPELAQSAKENPHVTYVFVHSGGAPSDYQDFLDSAGLDLANTVHLDDSPGRLWARFGVVQQPSNIFVDGNGNATQSLGGIDESDLRTVVAGLSES